MSELLISNLLELLPTSVQSALVRAKVLRDIPWSEPISSLDRDGILEELTDLGNTMPVFRKASQIFREYMEAFDNGTYALLREAIGQHNYLTGLSYLHMLDPKAHQWHLLDMVEQALHQSTYKRPVPDWAFRMLQESRKHLTERQEELSWLLERSNDRAVAVHYCNNTERWFLHTKMCEMIFWALRPMLTSGTRIHLWCVHYTKHPGQFQTWCRNRALWFLRQLQKYETYELVEDLLQELMDNKVQVPRNVAIGGV